jgi:quinol-cytochrome oxidoreductase complex cytochrome b subunit
MSVFDRVGGLTDWLDERIGYRAIVRQELTDKPAPRHLSFMDAVGCLGGLSFVLFIIQVVTGAFLMMFYVPHVDKAFESVDAIDQSVAFGWFLRNVHIVAASMMVVTVTLHMIKVWLTGAFKPPRELHWVSGFVLLLFTLAMAFTGYLLPWTQLAFWAATVVANAVEVLPFVGVTLAELMRGGDTIGQPTLVRFYAFHVAVIPGAMVLFLLGHFWMIRRTGIAEPL